MATTETVHQYQFGPLERRGLIAGFRGGQVAIAAVGALAVVGAAINGHPIVAAALATATAVLAFVPVGGRPAEAWAPVVWAWLLKTTTGGRCWVSDAALLGHVEGEPQAPTLPAQLNGVRILAGSGPDGGPMGMLREAGSGWRPGHRYTAVLTVRPQAFALCDSDEQARRLAGWGAVLAGLAREGSPVCRLQWLERTVTGGGGGGGGVSRSQLAFPGTHPLAASYLELVETAGPATQVHECYLAVQIDTTRAARLIKAAGGGDHGVSAVLAREVATLASALAAADVRVSGLLDPRGLARVIREAFDPAARPGLARQAALAPALAGVAPAACWPTATDEGWASYRADDTTHAVYWVEEWPRVPVRPDFLSRLLLGTRATRVVSVTIEPVSPLKATRQVERARANDIADDGLRSRLGFMSSARKRREQEGTVRREEELADGHAECRFSGYVAVSAPTAEALEDACGEVEQHARSGAVVLSRLRGQQGDAFAWTLPLCRGLR
jgi:Putative type VII ESX secretion system translocon, EccE